MLKSFFRTFSLPLVAIILIAGCANTQNNSVESRNEAKKIASFVMSRDSFDIMISRVSSTLSKEASNTALKKAKQNGKEIDDKKIKFINAVTNDLFYNVIKESISYEIYLDIFAKDILSKMKLHDIKEVNNFLETNVGKKLAVWQNSLVSATLRDVKLGNIKDIKNIENNIQRSAIRKSANGMKEFISKLSDEELEQYLNFSVSEPGKQFAKFTSSNGDVAKNLFAKRISEKVKQIDFKKEFQKSTVRVLSGRGKPLGLIKDEENPINNSIQPNNEEERICYKYGEVNDRVNVKKYCAKPANKGSSGAQLYLAIASLNNDKDNAFYWANEAAKKQRKGTYYLLGQMHQNGWGTEQNEKMAIKWYEKAFYEANDIRAMTSIASIYADKKSKLYDRELARNWAKAAINKGSAKGHFIKGMLFLEGEEERNKEAIMEFKSAARKNDVDSMKLLGKLYMYGDKVKRNFVESYAWYSAAQDHGAKDVYKQLLDLKKTMTPEEQARAKSLSKTLLN